MMIPMGHIRVVTGETKLAVFHNGVGQWLSPLKAASTFTGLAVCVKQGKV